MRFGNEKSRWERKTIEASHNSVSLQAFDVGKNLRRKISLSKGLQQQQLQQQLYCE